MNVFEIMAKIGLDTSEYENGLNKIASGVGKAAKVVGAAVGTGTAVVAKFGSDSVKVGMDFDSAMAQVAATSGKTMDELNNEIITANIGTEEFTGTLREFAQYMGSTTAFSASQAADALNYMALAGYDAETSMKMLPNVLNLASAGGIELAAASDMVTDAQTALGLSLDETSAMVDQMAKASSKTNTSVAQLGDAFLTIGANARNLKGGTTELSTVLGVLADNGIKGAEAGTHLRNIMLAMNPTTDAATAAWELLGVQAYDAEGNMRALPDIMTEIAGAMEDMTEQEKTNLLSDMFNKTDLAAVNALIGTEAERYAQLTEEIYSSTDAASAMAETQLDNLAGDVTLFRSALEGAKIAISDQLSPVLREFVSFGSDGLSRLTQAFQDGGLSGAMDVFSDLINDGIESIVGMAPQMVKAGTKLITALIKGIISNSGQIVEALPEIFDTLSEAFSELFKAVFEELGLNVDVGGIFELFDNLINGISEIFSGLGSILGPIIDDAVSLFNGVVSVLNKIAENETAVAVLKGVAIAIGIVVGAIEAWSIAQGILNAVMALNPMTLVIAGIAALIAIVVLLITYWDEVKAKASEVWEAIKEAFGRLGEWFKGIWDKIKDAFKGVGEWFKDIFKGAVSAIKGVFEKIGDFFAGVWDNIKAVFSKAKDVFSNIGKNIVNGIKEGITAMWDKLVSWFTGLWDGLVGGVKDFLGIHSPSRVFAGIGKNMAAGVQVGFDDEFDKVYDDVAGKFDSLVAPLDANTNFSITADAESTNEALAEAIREALDGYEIKWDDRNLGRLVRQYA